MVGLYQSISCWDNCRNNLGVVLTVATASWDTVMFVILHATLFDIYTPFYWCLTLCNENMIFDPQNKKMTPPPPSKPPSIGAWPLVMKIWNLTPKTKKNDPPRHVTPFSWCLTLCNDNMESDPQNKKNDPPPTKLTPFSWCLTLSYKTFDMTPLSWCLTLCNENMESDPHLMELDSFLMKVV